MQKLTDEQLKHFKDILLKWDDEKDCFNESGRVPLSCNNGQQSYMRQVKITDPWFQIESDGTTFRIWEIGNESRKTRFVTFSHDEFEKILLENYSDLYKAVFSSKKTSVSRKSEENDPDLLKLKEEYRHLEEESKKLKMLKSHRNNEQERKREASQEIAKVLKDMRIQVTGAGDFEFADIGHVRTAPHNFIAKRQNGMSYSGSHTSDTYKLTRYDIGPEITVRFEDGSQEEKATVLRQYLSTRDEISSDVCYENGVINKVTSGPRCFTDLSFPSFDLDSSIEKQRAENCRLRKATEKKKEKISSLEKKIQAFERKIADIKKCKDELDVVRGTLKELEKNAADLEAQIFEQEVVLKKKEEEHSKAKRAYKNRDKKKTPGVHPRRAAYFTDTWNNFVFNDVEPFIKERDRATENRKIEHMRDVAKHVHKNVLKSCKDWSRRCCRDNEMGDGDWEREVKIDDLKALAVKEVSDEDRPFLQKFAYHVARLTVWTELCRECHEMRIDWNEIGNECDFDKRFHSGLRNARRYTRCVVVLPLLCRETKDATHCEYKSKVLSRDAKISRKK